jgi:hypothetical protein
MLTTPAAPTDNLYKFIAIFGLSIVVAAGSFAAKLQLDREDASRVVEARALAETRQAEQLTKSSDPAERAHGVALADSVIRQADSAIALADRLNEKPSKTMPALVATTIAGALISAVGFGLWHRRFQKYQDIIIQRQAKTRDSDGTAV